MSAEGMRVDHELWRKSRRSVGNGACVEVTTAGPGIAVRDSQDPAGPVLAYTAASWHRFTIGARQGRFDSPR